MSEIELDKVTKRFPDGTEAVHEADFVITNPPFSLFREFVGWIVDGKVQILKGLKAGETIVAEGGYGLPDGTEVKAAEAAK